jgi:hypothetical protein
MQKQSMCSYLEVIMVRSHDKSKERKISRKRNLSFQRRENTSKKESVENIHDVLFFLILRHSSSKKEIQ